MMATSRIDSEGCRGSAALELAFALPVVLASFLGIVEFGRAFTIRTQLIGVAAEAARVGSQSSCPRPTSAQVLAAAGATLASVGLNPALSQIAVTNPGGAAGSELLVDVSYRVEFPLLSKFMNLSWAPDGVQNVSVHLEAENE